jgi:hypothetical protein
VWSRATLIICTYKEGVDGSRKERSKKKKKKKKKTISFVTPDHVMLLFHYQFLLSISPRQP